VAWRRHRKVPGLDGSLDVERETGIAGGQTLRLGPAKLCRNGKARFQGTYTACFIIATPPSLSGSGAKSSIKSWAKKLSHSSHGYISRRSTRRPKQWLRDPSDLRTTTKPIGLVELLDASAWFTTTSSSLSRSVCSQPWNPLPPGPFRPHPASGPAGLPARATISASTLGHGLALNLFSRRHGSSRGRGCGELESLATSPLRTRALQPSRLSSFKTGLRPAGASGHQRPPPAVLMRGLKRPLQQVGTLQLRPAGQARLNLDRSSGMGERWLESHGKSATRRVLPDGPAAAGSADLAVASVPRSLKHPVRPAGLIARAGATRSPVIRISSHRPCRGKRTKQPLQARPTAIGTRAT